MSSNFRKFSLKQKYHNLIWWQKLLVIFVVFIIFIVFMDSVVMPFYTRHGEEFKLPDVTEKQLQEAKDSLEEHGFIPIVHDSIYDSFYPAGTVIRQNPQAYSTVKKGRRVYLVLSSGEKPIIMPKLVEKSLQNAELLLRERGLSVNYISWQYSKSLPYRGVVIRQSISPGERIEEGDRINLSVSLGAPPSSREVPDLVGQSLESALKELEILNIPVGHIRSRLRPNLVPNTILSQSAPGGTAITEIDSIDLVVSTDQLPQKEDTLDQKRQQENKFNER